MRPDLPPDFITKPLAHRGFHNRAQGRIENAPAAIHAAIAAGYGIEIDVQLSRDGVAMVFHDETLDRVTPQSGLVCAQTAAQLGQIPLTGSADCIPTLADILHIIAGKVPLLIEIKDQTGNLSHGDDQLERATVFALQNYIGPVALMSFNPHSVAHVARLAPHIARGLTTSAYDYADWSPLAADVCDRLRDIPDYDRTNSSFISHEAADLMRPRVADLKNQGAKILCWTIKSQAQEIAARRIADNITFEQFSA